jgi:hypothetical protein
MWQNIFNFWRTAQSFSKVVFWKWLFHIPFSAILHEVQLSYVLFNTWYYQSLFLANEYVIKSHCGFSFVFNYDELCTNSSFLYLFCDVCSNLSLVKFLLLYSFARILCASWIQAYIYKNTYIYILPILWFVFLFI